MEIDKNWLVEAIIFPRNHHQINSQLQLAAKAAFEKQDFYKAFSITNLATYYSNSRDFSEEGYEVLISQSLLLNTEQAKLIEVKDLPPQSLVVLGELADSFGDFLLIDEIFRELNKRHNNQEINQKAYGSIPPVSNAILQILPYKRDHDVKRVHKYIGQFINSGWATDLFLIYSKKLLSLGQTSKVKELLNFKLSTDEFNIIIDQCIRFDFCQDTSEFREFYEGKSFVLDILFSLITKKEGIEEIPNLPNYDVLPRTVTEFDSLERLKWANFFQDLFYKGLIISIMGKGSTLKNWIESAPDIWISQAINSLFATARSISKDISQKTNIDQKDLFIALNSIDELKWPYDRDLLNLQNAFKDAIGNIFKDIMLIKYLLGEKLEVSKEEIDIIIGTPFFSFDSFFEVILDQEVCLLSNEVYQESKKHKLRMLQDNIDSFQNRTVAFTSLASLARISNDIDSANRFLLHAGNNFLGYG